MCGCGLLPQITLQKVSDFAFGESEELRVVAELGSQRQCSRAFVPRESTSINSILLLPVEQVSCVELNTGGIENESIEYSHF